MTSAAARVLIGVTMRATGDCGCCASRGMAGAVWIASGNRRSFEYSATWDWKLLRPILSWKIYAARSHTANVISTPTIRSPFPSGRTCGWISIICERDAMHAIERRPGGSLLRRPVRGIK
jgi:hypothetical protein